jgi:hypothetical protein
MKIDSRGFWDAERYRFHVLKGLIIHNAKNARARRLNVPSPLRIVFDLILMAFSVSVFSVEFEDKAGFDAIKINY